MHSIDDLEWTQQPELNIDIKEVMLFFPSKNSNFRLQENVNVFFDDVQLQDKTIMQSTVKMLNVELKLNW